MKSNLVHLSSSEFPEVLAPVREIPEPPKELWLAGRLPDEDVTLLCVVGSRRYTNYGAEVVRHLIAGLSGLRVCIVSGLALGIDSIAHAAALETGLHTMAVPGSGLSDKVLYPRSNQNLARKIIESGGCLLSEYAPETKAAKWTFPKRNRLMVGLSKAVLVIEAGRPSGTLITARLSTEYNRDLLAVPGAIFNQNAAGPNWLIASGATPITSAEDLTKALGLDAKSKNTEQYLTKDELAIVNLLKEAPLSRDDLIRQSGLLAGGAASVLISLELKGVITEQLGHINLR